MSHRDVASAVLGCVGGSGNVIANSLCMTRLRITVANPTAINRSSIDLIDGVLGTATRGTNGIEVVFGPNIVKDVFDEFSKLTGIPNDFDPMAGFRRHHSNLHVHISPGRRKSFVAQAEANEQREDAQDDDMAQLAQLLEDDSADLDVSLPDEVEALEEEPAEEEEHKTLRLLVINGPNINMLGIREPSVYGKQDFSALLELCKQTARNVGFADCRCFQSNHEGAIVDEIQDAYGIFDGLVINPGAYTHTSVAILDAVKAISIPTIEVHISKVEDREDFRQVSYIRQACLETITGLGIDGYRVAIEHMAAHLGL
ncbi:MAG: type II 3-dehydroquinate dehydratase [Atopobiaceae bacterium]|nr:type II 3-dehydroquinate dehydratase [Atopobiaceae bacterium]